MSRLVFSIRCEKTKAEEIRRKALKCRAGSVSTRGTNNPNQIETVAQFKKASDKEAFEKWATKKFKE